MYLESQTHEGKSVPGIADTRGEKWKRKIATAFFLAHPDHEQHIDLCHCPCYQPSVPRGSAGLRRLFGAELRALANKAGPLPRRKRYERIPPGAPCEYRRGECSSLGGPPRPWRRLSAAHPPRVTGVQPAIAEVCSARFATLQPCSTGLQPALFALQPCITGIQPVLSTVQPFVAGLQPAAFCCGWQSWRQAQTHHCLRRYRGQSYARTNSRGPDQGGSRQWRSGRFIVGGKPLGYMCAS